MAANISANPSKAVRLKLIEFADLYRGSPDENIRGNATACYMAIHPRSNAQSARAKATTYFKHPIVKERLQKKAEELSAKADISQDKVLREVARLGLYDVRQLFDADGKPLPINKLSDEMAAAIVGVEVVTIGSGEAGLGEIRKYKLADKNSALEKLMKHLGLYEQDNKQKGLLADLPRDVVQLIASKLRNDA